MAQAINSALAQTYSNTEVIVINDGAADDGATRQIATAYGIRIRYFEKSNGGVASALNAGLRMMNGDYFAWLSHDDIYHPTKIERQVAFLQRNRDLHAICYTDHDFIDERSVRIGVAKLKDISPNHFRCVITECSAVHGCSLLIPRGCFRLAGDFDENKVTTQDYDMWFRLAKGCRFIRLPEVLMSSRRHPNQGTVRHASIVRAEGDALYADFVRKLTDEEVSDYSGKAPQFFFLRLSAILYARGFLAAFQVARDRAKGSVVGETARTYLLRKALLTKQTLITLPFLRLRRKLNALSL